jgi:hypothetical protein
MRGQMKLHKDCIDCLARIVDQISENLDSDTDVKRELERLRQTVVRNGFRPDKCPPWLTTRILKEAAVVVRDSDPYRGVREKEMAAAREIFAWVRPLYGDDFRSVVELAVLGNNLDFYRDSQDLESAAAQERGGRLKFGIDHIEEAESKLRMVKEGTILFLADNAGEVCFDIPLVKKITSLGVRAVYGVKEIPFINDVTRADLERSGLMPELPRVLSTGGGAILDLPSLSPEFRREFEACDMIISKGQANYECLTELPMEKDVFFLLKAKCRPISQALHVPMQSYVALLSEAAPRV